MPQEPLPRPYRPILPASTEDKRRRFESANSNAKKKRGRLACDACRTRKSACDGQRPRCIACQKRDIPCLYTPRFFKIGSPDGELTFTEGEAGEAVNLLRTLPEDEALNLFRIIRSGSEAPALPTVSSFGPWQTPIPPPGLSTFDLLRGLLPPTQNGLEFELTVRHPIAYPTLLPLRVAALPLDELLSPTRFDQPQTLGRSEPPVPESSSASASYDDEPEFPFITHKGVDKFGFGDRPLVDDRLYRLDITKWTRVPISNDLAARAISLYLETDYQVMPVFNADLFLDDLVNPEQRFCSHFLVNALLAWQAYTPLDAQAAYLSTVLFKEAEMIWASELHPNTLTGVAGLHLLAITASTQGKDDLSVHYLRQGVWYSKRMGLFGVLSELDSAKAWLIEQADWKLAASFTAWGVFNLVSHHCMHFHSAEIECPPLLPKPMDQILLCLSQGHEHTGLSTDMATFNAVCDLWVIFHDLAWRYYGKPEIEFSPRVTPEFAQDTFRRLLAWADSLPLELARTDQSSHAVVIMHIYYHAIVTDLFRPLRHLPRAAFRLDSFTTPAATARAVYAASINQLMRMLVIYRLTFKVGTLSVLWHSGLIYVVNALVYDRNTTNGGAGATAASSAADTADWRFYFQVCLAGLQGLHVSFPVFGSIARALLCMALAQGAIRAEEASYFGAEFRETRPVGRAAGPTAAVTAAAAASLAEQSLTADGAGGGSEAEDGEQDGAQNGIDGEERWDGKWKENQGDEEEHAPRWIVDLDLAVTDPEAAQGAKLAGRFAELLQLNEIGHGVTESAEDPSLGQEQENVD